MIHHSRVLRKYGGGSLMGSYWAPKKWDGMTTEYSFLWLCDKGVSNIWDLTSFTRTGIRVVASTTPVAGALKIEKSPRILPRFQTWREITGNTLNNGKPLQIYCPLASFLQSSAGKKNSLWAWIEES